MQRQPRVLVIDDEEPVRISLRILLSKYCDVTLAKDGYQGIEEARRQDYDIAIIDIRMPGLSGIETLKQLKQLRPATEVLILTGGDYFQEPVKEAIKLGALDCILKPVHPTNLKAYVMEALRHRLASENSSPLDERARGL